MENKAYCIVTRQDFRIWITQQEFIKLTKHIAESKNKMITIAGALLNTVDVVGVFTGEQMFERIQMSRGFWKNKAGEWVTKKEDFARDPYIPSISDVESNRDLLQNADNIKKLDQ